MGELIDLRAQEVGVFLADPTRVFLANLEGVAPPLVQFHFGHICVPHCFDGECRQVYDKDVSGYVSHGRTRRGASSDEQLPEIVHVCNAGSRVTKFPHEGVCHLP